jgi:hypothetical protein
MRPEAQVRQAVEQVPGAQAARVRFYSELRWGRQ